MLKDFIRLFTNEEIVKDFVKIERDYFLVGSDIKRVVSQIKTKPCFEGIPLGCERGKLFVPSLFLLNELLQFTEKKVCVDSKGEWMFICGKDIFGKSVSKAGDCRVGDFVLVENQYGECLGYCRVVADLKERGKVLDHVFDVGDFLRRER